MSHPMVHDLTINTLSDALRGLDLDNPHTKAVITPDGQITEFCRLSSQISGIQSMFPIKHPRRVGILLDRASLLTSALAVLRAGGAFMLLNPKVASCYIETAVRRHNLDFVITRPGFARKCPGAIQLHLPTQISCPTEVPEVADTDDDSAAFFSGMRTVTRGQIMRLARELAAHTGRSSGNIVLPAFGLSDGDFILDSLATTLAGYTLAIMPKSKTDLVAKTVAYAEAEHVTIITARPFLRNEIERRKMTMPNSVLSILDRSCGCI